MKKILFLASAMMVTMLACQKESENIGSTNAAEGDVYMSFSVQLPETRSVTDTGNEDTYVSSDAGEEIGKNYENQIQTIDIFLMDSEGLKIAAENVAPNGNNGEYVATFKHDVLSNGVTYGVYVICNDNSFSVADGLDKTYTLSADNINENIANSTNGFLMTNAKAASVAVPSDHDWSKNMTKGTAFSLGIVEVERSVARFDYAAVKTDNIYTIADNDKVKIQLTDAGLINMSKSFYYFRRVASVGVPTNENPAVICGVETPDNYVIDTDAAAKAQALTEGVFNPALAANFLYHMAPSYTSLTAITEADNNEGWTNTAGYDYKIWRYVTENTIPNSSVQVNGISTGVVFKGILIDAENAPLTGNEPLYVYNNIFYGNWNAVKTSAEASDAPAGLKAAYEAISSKGTPTEDDYKQLNFTVYEPNAEGKYEVLYYYWNRHNDNKNNKEMGTMEFAVVRNNVYKLAVTNISKFGHPENGIDPDPIDPSDPDEIAEYYFTVAVKVLPWTVRINNIEF